MSSAEVELKVLYVEDEPVLRKLVALTFAREGIELRTAVNGREGVDLALVWLPDLIVMDLMLPVMDGFAAAEALREDPRTQGIPIVAFSAAPFATVQTKVSACGMNAFVAKSTSHAELVRTVCAHLRP